jgi:hypothetical protein
MEFKKFSAGLKSYGITNPSKNIVYEKGVTNVNFDDEEFWESWKNPVSAQYDTLKDFINILAVCHTIIVEKKDG